MTTKWISCEGDEMNHRIIHGFYQLCSQVRLLGGYIVVALLLPGGLLLALLVWLNARRQGKV